MKWYALSIHYQPRETWLQVTQHWRFKPLKRNILLSMCSQCRPYILSFEYLFMQSSSWGVYFNVNSWCARPFSVVVFNKTCNNYVASGKKNWIIIWRFFRRPLVYHWTIFNAKSMCLWVIVRRKSKPYKVDMGNSLTCVLEPTSAKLNLVVWYWQAMGMNPFVTNAFSFWKRKNWNSKAFPWGLLLHELFGTSLVPRPVKH